MDRASRAPLAALLFTVFLDLLGFGMVIPILALYAERFPVGDVAITAFLASYSFMQLFFAPIWGQISDRYGRRPVLLVSILGSCASQLGYAVAPGFVWLVIARAFAGICGANISAAQAYVADSTDEESRAAGMGMLGAAMGLGFVIGPMAGGVLGGRGHEARPFFVASGLALCNLVLAWFLLPEPRATRDRAASRAFTFAALARTVATARLRVLITLFFVVTFGFALLEGTFPLYLNRRFGFGGLEVGYVFFGIGTVIILVQGALVPRMAARVGERAMVIGGTLAMALGMWLSAAAHDLFTLCASVGLVAFGNAINTPALSSLISRAAGDRQGGVMGVSQSFGALARVVGPITGGFLLARGTGAPYLAAGVIMGLACVYAAARAQPPAVPPPART